MLARAQRLETSGAECRSRGCEGEVLGCNGYGVRRALTEEETDARGVPCPNTGRKQAQDEDRNDSGSTITY